MIDFNLELRKKLLEQNMSISQLASLLNMSRSNLSKKLEKNNPKVSDLEKLFNALGFEVELKLTKIQK